MKKVTFTAIFALFGVVVSAQPRAIGVRFGAPRLDISYQQALGAKGFAQIDAGLNLQMNGIIGGGGSVTYNWLFPIKSWTKAGAWNWYAGLGLAASGGVYSTYKYGVDTESKEFKDRELNQYYSKNFSVGFAGVLGVEYNFKFPLQLALDYRPVIGPTISTINTIIYGPIISTNGLLLDNAFALSVRYRF